MVKSKNNKIVLVYGHFNILHPGHLRLLRFAKECGQKLIVAVSSDRIADQAAHVPQRLRLEGVKANSWVDKAFIFDTVPKTLFPILETPPIIAPFNNLDTLSINGVTVSIDAVGVCSVGAATSVGSSSSSLLPCSSCSSCC